VSTAKSFKTFQSCAATQVIINMMKTEKYLNFDIESDVFFGFTGQL
jgi:hypothetical protein